MLSIAGGILIAVLVLATLPFWLGLFAQLSLVAMGVAIVGGVGYFILDTARTEPAFFVVISPIAAWIAWYWYEHKKMHG
jgi:hypothetical protein